jgi:hypothetical protein
MQVELKHRVNRRVALGSSAAALLALNAPRLAGASAMQKAVQGGGGAAGGGSIELGDGTPATFSVFATRLTVEGEETPLILGTVLLSAGGKQYVSTQVTDYGPIDGNPDGREINGFMTIDGGGNHPFHVSMPDLATNGFGTDTFGFTIWDSIAESGTPEASPVASPDVEATPIGEPIFNFEGPLTTGDIQLLDLKFTA